MSKKKQIVKSIFALTLFAASMSFANRNYTAQDAEIVKSIILNNQGNKESKRPHFTCVCYGGPGNYRVEVPPILATVFSGPGYYRSEAWVCPAGCNLK